MPPPQKGGALPQAPKESIRRSRAALSAGQVPSKKASSAATSKKKRASKKEKVTHGKSTRQKAQRQWHYFINKARREIRKDYSLSRRAMNVMGSFVEDMFERIASEAINVAYINKVKNLTGREIQMAVRLLMDGELLRFGMCEGTRAVHTYNTNMTSLKESRQTQGV